MNNKRFLEEIKNINISFERVYPQTQKVKLPSGKIVTLNQLKRLIKDGLLKPTKKQTRSKPKQEPQFKLVEKKPIEISVKQVVIEDVHTNDK